MYTQPSPPYSPGAEILSSVFPDPPIPVFLESLRCNGTEAALQDCPSGLAAIGLTTCDHSQDVAVRCTGEQWGGGGNPFISRVS